MPSKQHKKLLQKCRDMLSKSHSCISESPIYRDGAWRYLDLECGAIDPKTWKDCAIEGEVGSSKAQRESNFRDGMSWKNKDKENREFFQITDPNQLDINKLKKKPKYPRTFTPVRRFR